MAPMFQKISFNVKFISEIIEGQNIPGIINKVMNIIDSCRLPMVEIDAFFIHLNFVIVPQRIGQYFFSGLWAVCHGEFDQDVKTFLQKGFPYKVCLCAESNFREPPSKLDNPEMPIIFWNKWTQPQPLSEMRSQRSQVILRAFIYSRASIIRSPPWL